MMTTQEKKLRGRDEMNLAILPIATLGRNDSRDVIEFFNAQTWQDQRIYQHWTVRAAAGVGLPTEFADRVLVALISLSAQQGFTDKKVTFSIYRICDILEIEPSNRNYTLVRKALRQLRGVQVDSEDAWWDRKDKAWVSTMASVNIIDELWLRRKEKKDTSKDSGHITWSDIVFDSFQAGHVKRLNISFYLSLDNAVARRLYRLLDKYMQYSYTWKVDIFTLAGRLGMVRYSYPSEVKKKLKPAFDELIASGYLENVEVVKEGKYTRVVFTKVAATPQLALPFAAEEEAEAIDVIGQESDAWESVYQRYKTSIEHRAVWMEVLNDLSETMPSASFDAYMRDTRLLTVEAQTAIIGLSKAQARDWLENQMDRQIINALRYYLDPEIVAVKFVAAA